MGMNFTPEESFALYELLAENTSDIILKTDCEGYISYASPALDRPEIGLPRKLAGFHILDLVDPSCADAILTELDAVVQGRKRQSWIEFPAATCDRRDWWFELRMRRLVTPQNRVAGTINVMRSIQERVTFEEKLFVAAMTDPLTGLANRTAFISMLQHLVDTGRGGSVAIVSIDYFRAMNMRHGQSFGDEVLVLFSELLRTLMRRDDIIARIGGESLAVLMPGVSAASARAMCERIVTTLSDIRGTVGHDGTPITASIGLSPICATLDETMTRAEMALFLAKAKGRNRLEADEGSPLRANSAGMELPPCAQQQFPGALDTRRTHG